MTEAKEQKEFVKWFRAKWPEYASCIRVSMNGLKFGGKKNTAIRMSNMKAQGAVKGESDLFIAIPRNKFHGLFIEHKSAEGKYDLTHEQAEYLELMTSLGYMAVVTKGLQALKDTVEGYMG